MFKIVYLWQNRSMAYIKEYTKLKPKEKRQLAYKRRYKEDCPGWEDSMVLLTRLVNERIPPKADILDFGCGNGNFVVDELGDVFGAKIGFDVSADSVAKNVSMEKVVIGNGDNLPFEHGSFDAVTSLWALEHIKDPAPTFKEIFRVLRPGGFFAFVTPNRKSVLIWIRRRLNKRLADRILDRLYGRQEKDAFDVFYRANTSQDLAKLAVEHGFKVEAIIENQDPSYTSFNALTYLLSKWFSSLLLSISKPHIIAILRKPLG